MAFEGSPRDLQAVVTASELYTSSLLDKSHLRMGGIALVHVPAAAFFQKLASLSNVVYRKGQLIEQR